VALLAKQSKYTSASGRANKSKTKID